MAKSNHRPSKAAGIMILATLMLSQAWSALAGELAYGYRQFASAQLDGFKGHQGIRTDPATVNGIGYIHPTQMDIGSLGASFVAIGTAKGVGIDNCANDYDALWTVYVDGEIGGVYFCDDVAVDAYAAGQSPAFNISYEACQGAQRWVMKFGGTTEACLQAGAVASSFAGAGLETTGPGTTDRNIDVKYSSLQINMTGSTTWNNFGSASSQIAPNYSFTNVSTTAFNVFLAPLN